jgi:hypothetical protein
VGVVTHGSAMALTHGRCEGAHMHTATQTGPTPCVPHGPHGPPSSACTRARVRGVAAGGSARCCCCCCCCTAPDRPTHGRCGPPAYCSTHRGCSSPAYCAAHRRCRSVWPSAHRATNGGGGLGPAPCGAACCSGAGCGCGSRAPSAARARRAGARAGMRAVGALAPLRPLALTHGDP